MESAIKNSGEAHTIPTKPQIKTVQNSFSPSFTVCDIIKIPNGTVIRLKMPKKMSGISETPSFLRKSSFFISSFVMIVFVRTSAFYFSV